MKNNFLLLCCLLLMVVPTFASNYQLENAFLCRQLRFTPYLHTTGLTNKLLDRQMSVGNSPEFVLRLSDGTDKVGTDFWMTAKDFDVKGYESYKLKNSGNGVKVSLENKTRGIKVDVYYELPADKPYIHKYLTIHSDRQRTLERIDIDALYLEGSYQPYNKKNITAQASANWKPGLGQPVYNYINASYWGVEFPAATNTVTNEEIQLGYLWGKTIEPSHAYTSYKSVMGVADSADFIDDAFFNYIDEIRLRPLRFRLQYNCWFDLGAKVTEQSFLETSRLIHRELVEKRGVRPLDSYVIDDGWEDVTLPNFEKDGEVWVTNHKFSHDFSTTHKELKKMHSGLGLWLSPGSFFGSRKQVQTLREKGYEALSLSMSMAGPKYMDKLEERVLKLTKQGVNYFKFDGLFGHLNIRDFELNGRGVPMMPQLKTEGFEANDIRLNNPIYDELKTYYLVAGTERLIQMMHHQHEVNPNVYTAITNGAYLSPWWLQHTDAVWLINCGDAAGGTDRNEELVYRDGTYYDAFCIDQTKFPLNAIWNHEPKKTSTGESMDVFKDYLFMHLSRGTGFLELYLKPMVLSASDWDVLADGIKWMERIFPAFKHVKMVGGNPKDHEVYGYSGWCDNMGYISLHNPSKMKKTFSVRLDRQLGVGTGDESLHLSSPIKGDMVGLKDIWNYGDILTITLEPKEIRVLNFDKAD